jgi:phosphoglycolate phosphatase
VYARPGARTEPPQPSHPRAVVFDFDGTLAHLTIDFAEMRLRAEARILAAGIEPGDLGGLHVLELVAAACARLEPEAAASLADRCERAIQDVEVEAAASAQLLPGVREALARLRSDGLAVGVITRNCRQAVLRTAPDLLEHVGVLLARDDCPTTKPDPAHVRCCLSALGVAGMPAAVVGDHAMDMETARAGGWLALGVTSGAATADLLLASGAHQVFPGVSEVAAYLLGEA